MKGREKGSSNGWGGGGGGGGVRETERGGREGREGRGGEPKRGGGGGHGLIKHGDFSELSDLPPRPCLLPCLDPNPDAPLIDLYPKLP